MKNNLEIKDNELDFSKTISKSIHVYDFSLFFLLQFLGFLGRRTISLPPPSVKKIYTHRLLGVLARNQGLLF